MSYLSENALENKCAQIKRYFSNIVGKKCLIKCDISDEAAKAVAIATILGTDSVEVVLEDNPCWLSDMQLTVSIERRG